MGRDDDRVLGFGDPGAGAIKDDAFQIDIEPRTDRHIRAFVSSLIIHTILFALIAAPSKPPASKTGANRRAQIAQQQPVSPDANASERREGRQPTAQPDASKPLVPIQSTMLTIPNFTFDFAKIATRASALFPFLDLELSIPAGPAARFRAPGSRSRTGRGLVFVRPAGADRSDGLPRLRLSDTAFQTIVDVTWSRRARWKSFRAIRTLTGQYTGEEGVLPNLLRTYVEANALQPFYDTTIRDPRLWTELDIAADHVDFISFVIDYAVRHPSTRATTELLFLLDKLAQANFDALTTLVDIEPRRDLHWTAEANVDAYKLIRAMRALYIQRLGAQGIDRAALKARYDAARLQILRAIVRTTPEEYRANDARFLIGAIAWRAGDREAAVRTWRELEIRPGDYFGVSSSYVLGILNDDRPEGVLPPQAAARITKVLDNEDVRWLTFSTARLKRFGYTVDSY